MMRDWGGQIRIVLRHPIKSDLPFFCNGGGLSAEAGEQDGEANPQGAVSVHVDGNLLGAKPGEVVRWWYTDRPDVPFRWLHCAWAPESLAGREETP